jgi:hypothetical protein
MEATKPARHAPAILAATIAIAAGASVHAADRIAPMDGPWEAGKFKFEDKEKKTRQSLSGIACPGQGAACLVVFDEGVVAHYVRLTASGYSIENDFVRLRESQDELDAEATATDGKRYYVAGSHSAKRKTCESNPGSRHLLRFDLDQSTGKAKYSADGRLANYADTEALWSLMSSKDELKDYVGEGKCLGNKPPPGAPQLRGQRGVNIEGLAAKNGMLHVGFRGPSLADGTVPILSVDALGIFADPEPKGSVTMLRLGVGRGVRDLAAFGQGILILAGPDDDSGDTGWTLAVWDGVVREGTAVEPKVIAELDLSGVKLRGCDEELKPEALAVTKEANHTLELVIMSDGMCDGGPLKFVVPR